MKPKQLCISPLLFSCVHWSKAMFINKAIQAEQQTLTKLSEVYLNFMPIGLHIVRRMWHCAVLVHHTD